MNSSNHDYESTFEIPATKPERKSDWTKNRLERISSGLATYAIRLADEGHLNQDVLALSGLFGHTSFIKKHPEVYDIANKQLAEEGLFVQRTGLIDSQGFANWFEKDAMRVLTLDSSSIDVSSMSIDFTDT